MFKKIIIKGQRVIGITHLNIFIVKMLAFLEILYCLIDYVNWYLSCSFITFD